MSNIDALIMERNRQAQLFYDACRDATNATIFGLQTPMIDALAIALATFQGTLLTSIPAGRSRKEVSEMMERTTKKAIRENEGKTTPVQIVDLGKLQ